MNEISCRDLLGGLSEYIDGELRGELCAELERHLGECSNCKIVVDTLRKTVDLYHQESLQDSLPDEVRSRLFMCLDLRDYIQ